MIAGARVLVIAAALLTGRSAVAAPEGWPTRSFDPGRVETIKAGPGADPAPEVRCTIYADLIVRESGTDSPSPDAATVLRFGPSPKPPACGRTVPRSAVALKTADFSFVGRKGSYLFFEATDPNGAVPFMVVDAASGRTLLSDSTKDARVSSIAVENGALLMRFTRGINASCSLAKNAAACWTRLVHDGRIPAGLAQLPPPERACAASYRKAKVPADDPSVVSFDVDLRVANGHADIVSAGPIGCEPLP